MRTHSFPFPRKPFWLLLLALWLPLLHGWSQTPWVQAIQVGDEMRFLYGNTVRRYNLTTRQWLLSVTLPRSGATAFAGDGSINVVAYGTNLYRYGAGWSGEQASGVASSAVDRVFLDGSLIIATHSSGLYARITTFSRASGAQLNSREVYVDSIYGASYAPGINRLFGRTSGISPSDIVSASYTDAGIISGPWGSRYHGNYPGASRTFVFPDERRVVDTSGTVYTTGSLTYAGSFGGAVDDVVWNGDVPIVLRSGALIAFRNSLTEAGRTTLAGAGEKLAVAGGNVFVFRSTAGQPNVEIVPLGALNAPDPGDGTIDPTGLPFTVDDAFIDKRNVVHLLSKGNGAMFRWSTDARSYRPTLMLPTEASVVSYSAPLDRVYLLDWLTPSVVRKMELSVDPPVDSLFVNLGGDGDGMAAADDMLYSTRGGRLLVHSKDGALLNDTVGSYNGAYKRWDPVRRRLYHYRDGISPNDLMYEVIGTDGKIGEIAESPYHGTYSFYGLILVSPDGNRVITGAGDVFNATGLTWIKSLGATPTDGAWKGTTLVTIQKNGTLTSLQNWTGSNLTSGGITRQYTGLPLRIFALPTGYVVVTSVDGVPQYRLLDDALNTVYQSALKPVAPGTPVLTARMVDSISFQWADQSDNEEKFRIEYRVARSGSAWTTGLELPAGSTSATQGGLSAGVEYEFRVLAIVETISSDPSAVLTARTLISADEPVGAPYNLAVTRVYATSVTINWTDNANNETGFRILRSLTPTGTETVRTVGAGVTNFTDSGLTANTTYYYRVQVFNGAILGDISPQIELRTLSANGTPSAPTGVTVSEITANSVRLTWTDNSLNEDSFLIDRSANPVTTWSNVGTVGFNVRTYVVTGLTANTGYSFRVRAGNTSGSVASATVTTMTLPQGGEFLEMAMRHGNVYYLAFNGPNRIERYDLEAKVSMPLIPLEGTVTALWVDDGGIFVAEGRKVVRYGLDGTGRQTLMEMPGTVTLMYATDTVLVSRSTGTGWATNRKTTGAPLSTFSISTNLRGLSYDPMLKRAFARNEGVSPSDILYLDVRDDGQLAGGNDSAYHGNYPSASRTFVPPGGGRVFDDAGTIYSTDGLLYLGTVGSAFKDMAFRGPDVPVVLRGTRLHGYSRTMQEMGSVALTSAEPVRVAVQGNQATVFAKDGVSSTGYRIETVALTAIGAGDPAVPIEPRGLPYTADEIVRTDDGVLWILSRSNLCLFRWSLTDRDYLATVPLLGAPNRIAYSPLNQRLYLGYGSSRIRMIDTKADNPAEVDFASFEGPVTGLAAAGTSVFASGGSLNGYTSYNANGAVVTEFTRANIGTEITWDPVRRRVYNLTEGVSPYDIEWRSVSAAGVVQGGGESPYHGNYQWATPIRVRNDGERVAVASGQVLKATDLTVATTLSNAVRDLDWSGNELVSIRLLNGSTQIQRWLGPSLNLGPTTRQLSGTPVRVMTAGTGFLVVTQLDGAPRFIITDADLVPTFLSPVKPTPPGSLTSGARTDKSVALEWVDLSDNETSFRAEYRVSGSGGAWLTGATAAAGATKVTVTGLTHSTLYDFRVLALADSLVSDPSAVWTVRTLDVPDQPIGEPYNLVATRVSHNSITISWKDNANNETGFRVLRRTTPTGTDTVFPVGPNTTSYTSSGLTANSQYFFRVQVNRGLTLGDMSAQIGVATMSVASVPAAPTLLTATELSSERVRLSWRDNSTNEDSFVLERLSGGTWTTLQTLPFNTTTATVTTLEPGIDHTLRIRAINTTGSTESNSLTVKPPALGGVFVDLAHRSGNVQYFAFNGPFRIERYDLSTRQWLTPVPMQGAAVALWADDFGIYAAEDRDLVRWNLDGSGRQIITSRAVQISSIFTTGEVLGIYDGTVRTYNRRTGVALSSFSVNTGFSGPSVNPLTGRVFYRGPGSSAATVHFFDLAPDGTQRASGSGPAFGGFANAFFTWTFPDGTRVIDESGTMYGARSLSYVNRLSGNGFTDVTFRGGDLPIVLRGGQVVSFRNNMIQNGAVTLAATQPRRLAVSGSDVLVFAASGSSPNGMVIEVVPFTQLFVPEPGQPVDPVGLPYDPHDVFVDRDGALRMVSRAHLSLFRWSPTERKYTGSQLLGTVPNWLAYDAANDRLHFSDGGRDIWKFPLTSAAPEPFVSLPGQVLGLATAGEFLFGVDPTSPWVTHYVYNAAGEKVSSRDWNYRSDEYTWDPVRRRMYFYRDQSPSDLHFETIGSDGKIGAVGETPYHGGYDFSGPIRVSEDGALVMMGSGTVFRSSDMVAVRELGTRAVDMRWQGGQLITLENSEIQEVTRVQRWSASWVREAAVTVSGAPWRILPGPDGGFVVVTKQTAGAPRFHVLSAGLEVLSDSETAQLRVVRAPVSQRVDFGGDAVMEVQALGKAPLQYRWFRDGKEITGATGSRLRIARAGSLAAGTYEVRISDGTSQLTAGNIQLAVGPIAQPLFAPGSALLSGAGVIREYADPASAAVRQTITVERTLGTPFNATARIAGVTTDRLGRLHVLNHDYNNGSTQVHLSTYDPGLQRWQHVPLPGIRSVSNWSEGDLCMAGDWAVMNRGRFHALSGEWRPFSGDWMPSRVAMGPGGAIFGMSSDGIVRAFSESTETWGSDVTLASGAPHQAFAVGRDGKFYTFGQNAFRSFETDGKAIRALTPPNTLNVQNLAVGGILGQQITAGHGNATSFSLTQTTLLSESRTSAQNNTTLPGYFTAWTSPVLQPLPAFVESGVPSATEDIAWSWKPEVTHPDPDAVLTVEALSLPGWMTFANGVLSGTAAQADTGSAPVQLRVSDNSGRQTTWSLTVPVIEVNDNPVAAAPVALVRDEDAADEEIDLRPLVIDEETASLAWSIISNTGNVVAADIAGDRLRVRYLPNANGEARLTVRGTDAGGLSADALIVIAVNPVNDAPTGSLPPVTIDEDAPAFRIDLTQFFADIESPDAALTFTAVSSRPEVVAVSVAGGQLDLVPQRNANGVLTVTVRCADPEGLFVDAPFTLTVNPVNDVPVFSTVPPDVSAGAAGMDAVIDFAPYVFDPDAGEVLTWRVVGNTNPGIFRELSFDAAGRLTIRYTPYVSGTSLVTVEVSDRDGTSSRSTFTVVLPDLPPPAITQQSTLTLNRQTGLWEQQVTVRNDGQRAIGGFEIRVNGLPSGVELYNASDCLGTQPCAGHYQPVAPGASVSLVLEYYSADRRPVSAPQLSTVPTLPLDHHGDGTGLAIDRLEALPGGSLLLEFPADPGTLYQVQYSRDGRTWTNSLVRIRAAGTRVQWIDQGAPRTLSHPKTDAFRFYRVRKMP